LTSREPRQFLEDIVVSARLVREYLRDTDFAGLEANRQLQDSVVHRLEIIGEAAKNLPESIVNAIPEVPWARIRGMRNLLVHQYWEINIERVWAVIHNELPPLVAAVERYTDNSPLQ
jgi:uncharacterized protein with HEPN domain